MTLTESPLSQLGIIAPGFTLFDTVSERKLSLNELKSDKATVIMFICNHCPCVKHVNKGIAKLAIDYNRKGISFIAISSNDSESFPEDAPDNMRTMAKTLNYSFPYLYDESQEVAKAYDARCTPDFYVFDGKMKLVYHGQMDESRPSNKIPVTGTDIRHALDNILKGKPVQGEQHPSIGCGIKWK